MAFGGVVLSRTSQSQPRRTCVGCRAVDAQSAVVRIAVQIAEGASTPSVVLDRERRRPGRGAWVHPRATCIAQLKAGLSRSLRRQVSPADISRLVTEMSRVDDNSPIADQKPTHLEGGNTTANTVESPSRINAEKETDRSEDARL